MEDNTTNNMEETKETAAEKTVIEEVVEKLKALVKEGNVTHIRIRKGDMIILNLPMTAGVLGTILGAATAPWAMILATMTTIGLKCTVEVQKKDGTTTIIYGKED